MRKLEGTPITELIENGRIKSADVLLEHSRGSIWGWIVRFGTRNYWNHALMVCSVGDSTGKNEQTLMIDPRLGGIFSFSLPEYFRKYPNYDVAVKRLDKDWFQSGDGNNSSSFQKAVSAYALQRAGDKVTVAIALGTLHQFYRKLTIVTRFFAQKLNLKIRPRRKRRNKPINLNTYACSGIVQWSYYRGISAMMEGVEGSEDRIQEVTFSQQLPESPPDNELLSITPAELANSDKLAWKYVVNKGTVWEVSRREDVEAIIHPRKFRRRTRYHPRRASSRL